MEAASRPSLELLPDLPVEEPLDPATEPKAPLAGSTASPASGSPPASRNPEQTGLDFVDAELFLGEGQQPTAVPEVPVQNAPNAASPVSHEFVLEDPVVDEFLTPAAPAATPSPTSPPAAATPPPALIPAAGKPATGEAPSSRTSARVPIARTASLATAANKIAAASSTRTRAAPGVVVPPKPAVPAARPPGMSPAAGRAAASSSKAARAGTPAALHTAARKVEAQSLASWANARAATALRVNAAPAVPTVSPPASAPVAAAVSSTPPMDRDFVARNQVVERYLSGRLPVKGATDFERFCHEHPELLDEIGLPARVNAALRLLEASGKPEPWHEAPRPMWQKPQTIIALAGTVAALALALAIVSGGSVSKTHRIAQLQKEAIERALDPATSRREIRLLPSRSGASNSPAIIIGGDRGGAQLADFKIDESRSPYHAFRVTIDRIDQGRVGIINNLTKDSNGHLRIALNSSALGPGNYQLTLEGLDMRGEPQPDSWVTIGIVR